jgi:hypothetical protein
MQFNSIELNNFILCIIANASIQATMHFFFHLLYHNQQIIVLERIAFLEQFHFSFS